VARVLIEQARRQYNHLQPHGSLGRRPPAPKTLVWPDFSLADYALPTLTREPAPALSWTGSDPPTGVRSTDEPSEKGGVGHGGQDS
jgi:hypothetical protein